MFWICWYHLFLDLVKQDGKILNISSRNYMRVASFGSNTCGFNFILSLSTLAVSFFSKLIYFDSLNFIIFLIGDRSQDKGFNTEGALTHIFVRTESIQIPDDSLQICHELNCLHNNYIMQKTSRYVDIHVGLKHLRKHSTFSVYDKWT